MHTILIFLSFVISWDVSYYQFNIFNNNHFITLKCVVWCETLKAILILVDWQKAIQAALKSLRQITTKEKYKMMTTERDDITIEGFQL